MDAFDPSNCPGACVPCLVDTGRIVQMALTIDGVELCASCAAAHNETKEQASEGVDASFDGKRFHRHARNCNLCRPVLMGVKGDPKKLCHNGKVLYIQAVKAADLQRKAAARGN